METKSNQNFYPMKEVKEAEVQRLKDEREAINDERAYLLDKASKDNVRIVHIYDYEYPLGGLTVAFKPPVKNHRMVEVAVQTCSGNDRFSRKVGAHGALSKFYDGETINLPILESYEVDNINYAVKKAFSAFYDAVSFTNISKQVY